MNNEKTLTHIHTHALLRARSRACIFFELRKFNGDDEPNWEMNRRVSMISLVLVTYRFHRNFQFASSQKSFFLSFCYPTFYLERYTLMKIVQAHNASILVMAPNKRKLFLVQSVPINLLEEIKCQQPQVQCKRTCLRKWHLFWYCSIDIGCVYLVASFYCHHNVAFHL